MDMAIAGQQITVLLVLVYNSLGENNTNLNTAILLIMTAAASWSKPMAMC